MAIVAAAARLTTTKGCTESVAKKIRVHELAKELGMTNAETVDLADIDDARGLVQRFLLPAFVPMITSPT